MGVVALSCNSNTQEDYLKYEARVDYIVNSRLRWATEYDCFKNI